MVLIFSELNKTRIYKMPYTGSSYHEIEKLLNFDHLNSLKQMNTQKIITIKNQKMRFFFRK